MTVSVDSKTVDERIHGTWLSDKELTTRYWIYPVHLTEENLSRVENIFGKLQFTFSHTTLFTKYEDWENEQPYRVVASDSKSVVLETIEDGIPELEQWFFENEDIIFKLANGNIEYFRRVSAQ